MQSQKRQSIYDELSPHFQRLYIYDIEGEPLGLLQELLRRLKEGRELSADLQMLYNKLEGASRRNIQNRLKKKKQHGLSSAISSNASRVEDSLFIPEESSLHIQPIKNQGNILDDSNFSVDESMMFDIPSSNYKIIQSKSGKIFGGECLASFTLSDLTKSKSIETEFKIDSKRQQSTISRQTQQALSLKSSQSLLLVDNHREKFRLSDQNILGLRFLQQNKIMLQCNFRPEVSSFELSYTE